MSGLIILGSAFAIANSRQENAHLLVRSKGRNVLIDCGNNPVGKVEQTGLALNDITDLILTHAHADHMGALPLLLMDMWLRKRIAPLHVYGLEYTLERAKQLLDVFSWQNWADMFPVEFHKVEESKVSMLIDTAELSVSVGMVQHLIPTIGVKVNLKDKCKQIVYSCDTEPCENLDRLCAGADVLIQEAAGPGKGHTSPEQAGVTAAKAGVSRLILIHFDAGREPRELIAEAGTNYLGKIELASDLMEVI
jgi:ribonuclease Z